MVCVCVCVCVGTHIPTEVGHARRWLAPLGVSRVQALFPPLPRGLQRWELPRAVALVVQGPPEGDLPCVPVAGVSPEARERQGCLREAAPWQ